DRPRLLRAHALGLSPARRDERHDRVEAPPVDGGDAPRRAGRSAQLTTRTASAAFPGRSMTFQPPLVRSTDVDRLPVNAVPVTVIAPCDGFPRMKPRVLEWSVTVMV